MERIGANRRERRENNGEFRVATTGDSHHRGDGNRPGGAGQGQVGGGEAGGVDRFGKSQCGTGGQPARLGELPDSHLGPGHINWRSADDPVHGEDIGGLAIGTVAILVHRIAGGVEHIRAHFERVGANRRERWENNGKFRVATAGDSHH